jgi:Tfp pilus assembly protein PilF
MKTHKTMVTVTLWATLSATLIVAGDARAAPMSPTETLIAAGSQKIEDGDFDGALEKLDRAARLDSQDPRPRFLAAVAYEKKGDAKAAERLFREALKLDPKLAEVRGELGALLHDQKRYDEAIHELEQAVKDKADLGDVWFNLGQAYLGKHNCESAAKAFERAAPLQPGQAEPYVQEAIAWRACKKLDPALKAARQAVKVAPQSALAQLNLGITLEKSGKLDDARTAYTAATKLKADYGTAFWSLGLLELHTNHAAQAKAALERAHALEATPARTADLGRAYRDLGDLAKAEALFREALAKDARYAPAHFFLAQVLSATGRCPDMERELGALPGQEGHNEDAKKLRADCKR